MMLDAVVIGAGQAGLGTSYYLRQAGRKHMVLERGEIGETWRSQRWDSFTLNTPNHINLLPGDDHRPDEPDGFWTSKDLVDYFVQYARKFQLPIRTETIVKQVTKKGANFLVSIEGPEGESQEIEAANVVIASGFLNVPRIPGVSGELPEGILQLHAATYRDPKRLPEGAVLVVGGGQSGCQIAEDLVDAGRRVILCSSKVGRIPRRYRGRDIVDWMLALGSMDQHKDEVEDPAVLTVAQPQISGVGRFGHSLSYQHLAAKGVGICGRLAGFSDGKILFEGNAAENIRFADEFSAKIKKDIDGFIARNGVEAPDHEPDPADESDLQTESADPRRELTLEQADIGTIIWATGFEGDFSWLDFSVEQSAPNFVASVEGLFFIGAPWLRKRKSGIIHGINEDAKKVVEEIVNNLE